MVATMQGGNVKLLEQCGAVIVGTMGLVMSDC
jgi:hypothetical protein